MRKNIKNNKDIIYIILNMSISIIAIILLVIFMYWYNFVKPFPERMFISQMDNDMLKSGQGKNLIIMVSLGFGFCFFSISNIPICGICLYTYFAKWNLFYKKRIIFSKLGIFWYWTWRVIFCIMYYILPILFSWYFILVFLKKEKNIFTKKHFIINHNKLKKDLKFNRSIWISTIMLTPMIMPSLFLGYLFSDQRLSSKIDQRNINEYLTLSNSNYNVIYFYFDRGSQIVWNLLLELDRIYFRDRSFISMFPEFTSYTNTLALCKQTIYSNPSMYGGPLFTPWIKNSNSLNISSGTKNSEILQTDWYYYSLLQWVKMLKNFDIDKISFNNLPFYGKTHNSMTGEMHNFQKDIKNRDGIDVTVMDNELLSFKKFGLKLKNYQDKKIVEQYALDNLSKNYVFKNTKTPVFNSFFSQIQHVNYNYKKNGVYKTSINDEYFILSTWQTIQTLKDIFLRLKNEPFLDKNGLPIYNEKGELVSVYDRSLIFLVSDHGYQMDKKLRSYKKLMTESLKFNIITNEQADVINNFNFFSFNPVIILKDFWDKNFEKKSFFNYNQTLALTDLPIIMENYLNSELSKNNNTFWDESLITEDILEIRKSYSKDPLNETKKRKFYLTSADNWGMYYKEKKFGFSAIYEFDDDSEFFKNSNFKKIK